MSVANTRASVRARLAFDSVYVLVARLDEIRLPRDAADC